jgi:DNA-binding GntR family transcriptional regulator
MPGSGRLEFRTREQLVYDFLRRSITEGRWGPEDPIIGSRVAAELGVSRITIANALKRLAGEGFVRLTPHKEAVVAPLDPAEIEEIYVMRAALEAEAASIGARRATPEQLGRLRAMNEQLRQVEDSADTATLRRVDLALHAALRDLAGMPRLAATIVNLVDQGEYYRARLLDIHHILRPTAQRHEALLAALEAHDAAQAHTFMYEHVIEGMRSVLDALDARPTTSTDHAAGGRSDA